MAETPKMSTKGQMFWNAYGNIQAGIQSTDGYDFHRELLTYIQADDRYLSYVDEYLATTTDLPEPAEDIRARAAAEHETAFNVLETSPGFSTDMRGSADDFYFVIEQEYPHTAPVADTTLGLNPEFVAKPAYFFLQERQPTLTAMDDFDTPETAPLAGTTFGLNPEFVVSISPAFLEGPQPVMKLMGDFAMLETAPLAGTTFGLNPEIVADIGPVFLEEPQPVMTLMGDFAMPETPAVEETQPTVTTTLERPYDEDFTRTQLGELAEPPQEEFTLVTESIAPEVMPVPLLEEIQPDAAPVIEAETSAETTSSIAEDSPNAPVTDFSDASVLLNGEASDDMAYLANLVEEAREMGVDAALIDSIESQIVMTGDQTKFVTTAAATEAVSVYADALDRALADGTVGRDEYGQALSGLFTAIAAGGIVTDRAGMVDDIAAAPGMEEEAKASLRRVFDTSVTNRAPVMETSQPVTSLETQRNVAFTPS